MKNQLNFRKDEQVIIRNYHREWLLGPSEKENLVQYFDVENIMLKIYLIYCIICYFIMDQVVQRSLKSEILEIVNELSQDNNELLLWLQKVNEGHLQDSPQLSEKLEKMKSEIK